MYVSAPVRSAGEIVGVVSVGKPGAEPEPVRRRRRAARPCWSAPLAVARGGGAGADPVAVAGAAVGLIADYVRCRALAAQFQPAEVSGAARSARLGAAYDEMRDALAGRHYVADYAQTLTHELKSPLSAIRWRRRADAGTRHAGGRQPALLLPTSAARRSASRNWSTA